VPKIIDPPAERDDGTEAPPRRLPHRDADERRDDERRAEENDPRHRRPFPS
jgi:hypothetical protein